MVRGSECGTQSELETFLTRETSALDLVSNSGFEVHSMGMADSSECTRDTSLICPLVSEQLSTSMTDMLGDFFHTNHQQIPCSQDIFGLFDLFDPPPPNPQTKNNIEDSTATSSHLRMPVLEHETEDNFNTAFDFSILMQNPIIPPPLMSNSPLFARRLPTNVSEISERVERPLSRGKTNGESFNTNAEFSDSETETGTSSHRQKRLKTSSSMDFEIMLDANGQRMTHIAVERNRRKQMNEHLGVLRSLMPGFYVQRADQASIIGGVIEFIKELQQLLQSLESQKQRKSYSDVVLSPRPCSSPRPPISPRTPPQLSNSSAYRANILKPFMDANIDNVNVKELVANSKSAVADVEVKIAGSNAILKTLSHRRMPGQILKVICALENLSLEILHLNISTIDDTVLNTYTLKIGIECKLTVEELAQAIQQTFLQC